MMRASRFFGGLLWILPVVAAQVASGDEAAPPPVGVWTKKAKLGIALTQSSVSQNWSGDEVGTVSWLSTADFLAESQVAPRLKLSNTLVLSFGQLHQQDVKRDNWLAPQKSADKIDYDGVARFTLGHWLDPFAAITFDSQFFQKVGGVSQALNPWQVGESVGIARAVYDTPSRGLVSRFGFALRQRHDHFAVERSTNDGGLEWRTTGRFSNGEDRTIFNTELTLFQAVFFSDTASDPAHRWKTIDVRWQNKLSNKINKWLAFNLYAEYLFDDQLSRAGQFKQSLGFGVTAAL